MPPADDPTGTPPPSATTATFADAFTEPLKAAMSFGKFVPGFDFLEQWTRQAHAALPTMGQWVAPTLDPAELEKRIQDLRTVQFWLEQNARMLGMTIQALEVQRMTLATLQGMNVPVDALRESLKARPAGTPAASGAGGFAFGSAGSAAQSGAGPSPASPPASPPAEPASHGAHPAAQAAAPDSTAAPAAVDPMRWWGELTQQFTQLAASTMQDAMGRERAPAKPPAGEGDASDAAAGAGHAVGRAARTSGARTPTDNAAPRGAADDDAARPPRGKARSAASDKPARR